MQRAEIIETLSHIFDMERLMTRTVYGSATPKEVYALAATCAQLPRLRQLTEGFDCPQLKALAVQIDPLTDKMCIRDSYISLQQSGRMPAVEPTLMQGVAGSKEKALEQGKKENHGSV